MHPVCKVLVWMAVGTTLAALPGCESTQRAGRSLEQNLNPFASATVSVLGVERHGPYLIADIVGASGGSGELTLFAPADEPGCAALLRPEARVLYRKHGYFGRFENDDVVCDAVGVGSLAQWRDRQPRPASRNTVVPRATVRFTEIARDEQVALVRGRFPLASRVGIPAGWDLVAMLPVEPACERPLARGEGSLEFVVAGRQAFRIVGDRAPCPVLGFALPLEGAPEEH